VGTRAYHLWNHEVSDLNQPLQPLDSNFSDATGNFGRPYFNVLPDLSNILPLDFPQLQMTYNAFQASLNKRLSNGFNFLASYTLAHNLGNADGNVGAAIQDAHQDRKSTRLNSSHVAISYAVFCLKKKKNKMITRMISARR